MRGWHGCDGTLPNMASIFTRIIRGEIPCHKLFEDDLVIAFLDVNPLSPGHALVVPKQETAYLHQLSAESAMALGAALPLVAGAILKTTGATAYNVLQNNGALAHQEVPHVHFHIIPKYADGSGLGIMWKPSAIDHPSAAALAALVVHELRG
jgi:histidine triad (HIT) family protein